MICLGWFVAGAALGFIAGVVVLAGATLWWARREKTTQVSKEQLPIGHSKTVN